jgi:hypothetical protein
MNNDRRSGRGSDRSLDRYPACRTAIQETPGGRVALGGRNPVRCRRSHASRTPEDPSLDDGIDRRTMDYTVPNISAVRPNWRPGPDSNRAIRSCKTCASPLRHLAIGDCLTSSAVPQMKLEVNVNCDGRSFAGGCVKHGPTLFAMITTLRYAPLCDDSAYLPAA